MKADDQTLPDVVTEAARRMRRGMGKAADTESFIRMFVDSLDGIDSSGYRVALHESERSQMVREIINDSNFKIGNEP